MRRSTAQDDVDNVLLRSLWSGSLFRTQKFRQTQTGHCHAADLEEMPTAQTVAEGAVLTVSKEVEHRFTLVGCENSDSRDRSSVTRHPPD